MGFQFGTKTKQAGQENSTASLRKTVRPFDSVRPILQSQRTIGNEEVSEKPGTPLGNGAFRSPVTSARRYQLAYEFHAPESLRKSK